MRNKKKMNIFLLTTLWIVLVPLVLILFLFCISGFNIFSGMIMLYCMALVVSTILLAATSFLLGYSGMTNLITAISIFIISGIIIILVSRFSIPNSLDSQFLFGVIKILILFVIAFGAGYLGRNISRMWFIIDVIVVGGVFLYIGLGQIANGSYSPLNYKWFWTEDLSSQLKYSQSNSCTKYYKQIKMLIDPFPARVVGIRYHNDKGEFVGYSNSKDVEYEIHSIGAGEMTSDNSDILLHEDYEENLRAILGSANNAIRQDNSQSSVLLYYHQDTLFRKEIFYYTNGVVNVIDNYYFEESMGTFESYQNTSNRSIYMFDPLGYLDIREWNVRDFHKSNGVSKIVQHIGISLDSISGKVLDESQQKIVEMLSIADTMRNELRNQKISDDPLAILLKASQFAPTSRISIKIDKRSNMWDNNLDNGDFTELSNTQKMGVVCDALALCRLESGMMECHRDGICDRIRINEIGTDNFVVLYLFDNMAISADLRFIFIYDPISHTDPKKQADAKRIWDEMKQVIKDEK